MHFVNRISEAYLAADVPQGGNGCQHNCVIFLENNSDIFKLWGILNTWLVLLLHKELAHPKCSSLSHIHKYFKRSMYESVCKKQNKKNVIRWPPLCSQRFAWITVGGPQMLHSQLHTLQTHLSLHLTLNIIPNGVSYTLMGCLGLNSLP